MPIAQGTERSQYPNLEKCDRDGYRLIGQGLATIVRIAQQKTDLKQAMAAGQWLIQYGENVLRERHAKNLAERVQALPSDRESIIGELRGLYSKALGASALIVESQPQTDPAERS